MKLPRIDPHRVWTGIARYRAVGVTLVAIVAMVAVFPAVETPDALIASGQDGGGRAPARIVAGPQTSAGPDGAASNGGTSAGPGAQVAGEGDAKELPANCDPSTGKIKFPSVYAPPCVYPVSDNGGATYQGVTADTIKVVRYRAQSDPAVDALIRAAGAADTPEDVDAQYRAWFEMFESTYETYGRHVTFEQFDASAPTDDDAAARADAITVATTRKPFLVMGGPEAFIDELARRGIVVISQAQGPINYFADRAPFVYGTQMSSTQAYLHLAEYIGKRLKGGKAIHAGNEAMHQQGRRFGLVYAETPAGLYGPGVRFFEAELKRYGVTLTDKISYLQDINTAQEQSRTIVSRLKDNDITTVLFMGDPVAPIFFTQESTSQDFFPEWVIPGGTLVDTSFFGRTYDQRQWSNAFGISQLWIRPPPTQTEVYHQHNWFHGRPPIAKSTNEILYQEPLVLFTGLHLAGPNLNPGTFRDGLFAFPPSGGGRVTQLQRSWGNHGIYPFTDWTGFDTTTEVWWDPQARGSDEVGNEAAGQYRFVEGGKRYAPGEWPSTPPKVFDRSNSRTSYDSLPPSDDFPRYPKPE